jgi:hypothetical protein
MTLYLLQWLRRQQLIFGNSCQSAVFPAVTPQTEQPKAVLILINPALYQSPPPLQLQLRLMLNHSG